MSRAFRLACSFCGRSAADVEKLVAGSHAYICDRCVAIASDIMKQAGPDSGFKPVRRRSFWVSLVSRLRSWFVWRMAS